MKITLDYECVVKIHDEYDFTCLTREEIERAAKRISQDIDAEVKEALMCQGAFVSNCDLFVDVSRKSLQIKIDE